VKDDYGVSRCVLRWTKSTVSDPNRVTDKGEVEQPISPPRRQALVTFNKVFEGLAVEPGDRITFRLVAYDNRRPEAQMASSAARSLFVYQQDLDSLKMARLGFGSGQIRRARIAKSRRATSVKMPAGSRLTEKFVSDWKAEIETATRAPRIPGAYSRHVKDYFRLMSTAVENGSGEDRQGPGAAPVEAPPEGER
jgi:hypothetical protein